MAFVSTRTQTIAGRRFKRNAVVPDGLLTSDKASQLVGLRRLRDTSQRKIDYIALRRFRKGNDEEGKPEYYTRGERVDVSKMAPTKIAQLLEQRYLEPAA